MDFLALIGGSPKYYTELYNRNSELFQKSYADQKLFIDGQFYGWGDCWSHSLKSVGKSGTEIYVRANELQTAWAKERGVPHTGPILDADLIIKQVNELKPRNVFVVDILLFDEKTIASIRKSCPSVKKIIGWTGIPLPKNPTIHCYDIILSCIPEVVEHLKKLSIPTEHLNHAFDKRVLRKLHQKSNISSIDINFLGQIHLGEGFHSTRLKWLSEISNQIDVKIFSEAAFFGWHHFARKSLKSFIRFTLGRPGTNIKELYDLFKLKGQMNNPKYGLEMFEILKNSKISLNQHIDISKSAGTNMRLFEATGVGSCLLTDYKPRIRELFEPDSEIVTYKSNEECIEKARWLLDHPKECHEIGMRGQARTLRDHTYEQRAPKLASILDL